MTRKSFSASRQMEEKEFTGDVTNSTCMHVYAKWGGPSAMVWAAMSADHRSDLVFIDGKVNALHYRDEILGPVVLPFLDRVGCRAVFQHDNARSHVARVCINFLMESEVHMLPWNAVSPDLNPIEMCGISAACTFGDTPYYTAVEGCTGGKMGGHSRGAKQTLVQVHEAIDGLLLSLTQMEVM